MSIHHSTLHRVCIDESDVSLYADSLVFEGEFSVSQLRSIVLGEPFNECFERVEIVVVNAQLLFSHIGGKNYIVFEGD